MKCDVCDKEASVFLTQIVDGKMTQVNLCENCSKEKGVTDPTGFQLADFILGASSSAKPRRETREEESLACPACGFTRAHLKKIGRLGCPECYHTFAQDLDNMLKAMHKGTRHVGKVPGKSSAGAPAKPVNVKRRLGELKDEIDRAVAEERYEDAARLRDEMRELEAGKN